MVIRSQLTTNNFPSMSIPVISVENLSKACRIGLKEEIPDSLMDAATSWIKSPWRNFQRLWRLTKKQV